MKTILAVVAAVLTLAHTRTFREKRQAGLGSPFDERLYNNLQ